MSEPSANSTPGAGVSEQSYQAAVTMLRRMISTPSPSKHEAEVTGVIASILEELGLTVERHGRNLVARVQGRAGPGPRLLFNSHMDTVPPNPGYTRDPHAADIEDGKLYGLGSNDAGASVVAMSVAAAELARRDDWAGTLELTLVVEEEISGREGAEALFNELGMPDAAIVGEPTALNVCVAQKGLVVINGTNRGHACHAANAYRVPHHNAILDAMADIAAIGQITFDERDERLGPTTLNVTTISGGVATNAIPDLCTWTVDGRVNPAQTLEGVVEVVRAAAVNAEIAPRSLRMPPYRTPEDAPIVRAALAARPGAVTFSSDTMSDAVFLRRCPVIKCGPGITEMSHKPDEYVELHWIREGIAFYRDVALRYFADAGAGR